MDREEIKEILVKSNWFKDLDAETIDQIAQRTDEKKYKAKEFLYMPGEVQDSLYYVVSGTVQISIVGYAGNQFILTSMKGGQWFGEGSIVGMTKVLEVQTVVPSTLLVIPLNSVKQVVGTEATFYKNLLEDHMSRVQLLYELIAGMLFLPLRARLAGRFLYLLEMFGNPTEEGVVLDMKFSQQDFARMSMGSRQRINKIFREWQTREIYTKRSGKYIVMDVEALMEEMEADGEA